MSNKRRKQVQNAQIVQLLQQVVDNTNPNTENAPSIDNAQKDFKRGISVFLSKWLGKRVYNSLTGVLGGTMTFVLVISWVQVHWSSMDTIFVHPKQTAQVRTVSNDTQTFTKLIGDQQIVIQNDDRIIARLDQSNAQMKQENSKDQQKIAELEQQVAQLQAKK